MVDSDEGQREARLSLSNCGPVGGAGAGSVVGRVVPAGSWDEDRLWRASRQGGSGACMGARVAVWEAKGQGTHEYLARVGEEDEAAIN